MRKRLFQVFCGSLIFCSPLCAEVDVAVEQIGAPRYIGEKIVVGFAITNNGQDEASVTLVVADDFPAEFVSGRQSGEKRNPKKRSELRSGEMSPGTPELFRYYPMGEASGWNHYLPIPKSSIQYSVYYELTVNNVTESARVQFTIRVPQTGEGKGILKGFWNRSLCDRPTINHCSIGGASKLGEAFWNEELGNRSEYAFDLAFSLYVAADMSNLSERFSQEKRKFSGSGIAEDVLGEFEFRTSKCLKISEQQESLRCVFGVLVGEVGEDASTDGLVSKLSSCTSSSEYVNSAIRKWISQEQYVQ